MSEQSMPSWSDKEKWEHCRDKVFKTVNLYQPSAEQLRTLAGYLIGKAKMKKVMEREEWKKLRDQLAE